MDFWGYEELTQGVDSTKPIINSVALQPSCVLAEVDREMRNFTN